MRYRALFLLLLLFALAACSTIGTYDARLGRELSKQEGVELQKWRFQGRLSIKSDELLTANILWRHDKEKDQLKLFGALGIGAMQIELNEHEIVLDTGEGEKQRSQDIDAFIARKIGFVVPLTALRQWVVGRYLPGVSVLPLENGFKQSGWRITYNEYMQTSVGVLPRKINISKEKIKLKLIIDQWDIE